MSNQLIHEPCSPHLQIYIFSLKLNMNHPGLYRIQTLDLCDTSAVLYQVNCVYNKPTQWSAPSLLVGSIGRMVYWHRRDQGFKSTRTFQAFFSNCKNCIYNCDDLLSFHSSPCTYHKNYMIIILTILFCCIQHCWSWQVCKIHIIYKPIH